MVLFLILFEICGTCIAGYHLSWFIHFIPTEIIIWKPWLVYGMVRYGWPSESGSYSHFCGNLNPHHGPRQGMEMVIRARNCRRLSSQGIESKESIPSSHSDWRAGTSNRVVVPVRHRQAGNRFSGSLKGIQIWAQAIWPYCMSTWPCGRRTYLYLESRIQSAM